MGLEITTAVGECVLGDGRITIQEAKIILPFSSFEKIQDFQSLYDSTLLVELRFKRPKFFDHFSSNELFQDFQSLYDSTSRIM
jgi:hypothetical protein